MTAEVQPDRIDQRRTAPETHTAPRRSEKSRTRSQRPTDRFPRQIRFDAYWAGPPGVVGPREGKPPEESVDPSAPLPDAPGPAGRVFGAKRDFAS